MRCGKAASFVMLSELSTGMPAVRPVANKLGAMVMQRMPKLPRSRAIVNVIAEMPPFAAL